MKIVKDNNYEGVFAWELSGDSSDYELTNAMNEDVNRKWAKFDKFLF